MQLSLFQGDLFCLKSYSAWTFNCCFCSNSLRIFNVSEVSVIFAVQISHCNKRSCYIHVHLFHYYIALLYVRLFPLNMHYMKECLIYYIISHSEVSVNSKLKIAQSSEMAMAINSVVYMLFHY